MADTQEYTVFKDGPWKVTVELKNPSGGHVWVMKGNRDTAEKWWWFSTNPNGFPVVFQDDHWPAWRRNLGKCVALAINWVKEQQHDVDTYKVQMDAINEAIKEAFTT